MPVTRRTFLLTTTAAVAALQFTPALAGEPAVFATDGVAIHGYDPVAYFVESKPVEGSAARSYDWNGATWHFSSLENLAKFQEMPEAYAPQYGGYCAYAASKGAVATTDPNAWTVYEGKLYLNFSVAVRGIWQKDIPGNIAKADQNWPAILN